MILTLFGVPAAQASPCKTGRRRRRSPPSAIPPTTACPGGSFESGTNGWSLTGASVVAGNEPWKVGGSADSKSLSAPRGQAVSPAFCVGIEHPTFRFFARRTSGGWGVAERQGALEARRRHQRDRRRRGQRRDTTWHATESFNLAQVLGIWNDDQSVQVQFVFDPEDSGGAGRSTTSTSTPTPGGDLTAGGPAPVGPPALSLQRRDR